MNNKEKYIDVTVENYLTFDCNSYIHIHIIQIEDRYNREYYFLLRDLFQLIDGNRSNKKATIYTEEELRKSDILKNNINTINYIKSSQSESEVVEIVDAFTALNLVLRYVAKDSIRRWFLTNVYNTIFLLSTERSNLIINILRGEMTSGGFHVIHNKPEKVYTETEWKTDILHKCAMIAAWLGQKSGTSKQLKDGIHYCILELNKLGYNCNDYRGEYILKNQNNKSPLALDIIEFFPELKDNFAKIVDDTIKENEIPDWNNIFNT